MLQAEQINAKLTEKLQEKCIIYPQNNLRCSSIGHPCPRYIYLCITNWQDRKVPDVGLQGIFQIGNALESHVIERIKEAGYEVITPTTRSFRIEPQNITGREDLRIKDPETGEMIPVEIKTVNPFIFPKLNSFEDFVKHPKPFVRSYAAQIQLYLYHFAKPYGFFALINKLTGEIKMVRVDLDYEFCEALLRKAEYINKCLSDKKPPETCDDIGCCENCDLQHICGTVLRSATSIDGSGELEALIEKKQELAVYKKQYEETDAQIKMLVGEREKVLTGSYLVTRKAIHKKAYTVAERTEYRLNIKKL